MEQFPLNRTRALRIVELLIALALLLRDAGSAETIDPETIKPSGQRYSAQVPATLDLAERARMLVHVLTSNVEPKESYSVYQSVSYGNPPAMRGLTFNITPKNARTLPWMRVMSGSEENLEVECRIMETLLSNQSAEDGLIYYPVTGDANPRDTSYPYSNAIAALALLNWHQRDGDPRWLDRAESLCRGLERIAIKVEDRAYFPPESGYKRDGSWLWTLRGEAKIPYTPPAEPDLEQQGLEGTVKYDQAGPLRALTKFYQLKGDPRELEMARRLVRFCMKPGMWEDTSAEGFPGHEHGVFAGHFHGNHTAFHALLDYALVTGDDRLMTMIREAYNHGTRTGVLRMGWYQAWLRPEKHHRSGVMYYSNETCAVADHVILAVKMTDAGIGDYWDDVDVIVRNHFIAQQITDMNQLRALSGNKPEHDALLSRFLGGFGQGEVTATNPGVYGCCTVNGANGLYYAWHGITRFDQGLATVNLFLNRAAPWLDVASYLPFEGKVVITNKLADTLMLRVPHYVDAGQLRVFKNDAPTTPRRTGNYLMLGGLDKGDVIRLEFPVKEFKDHYEIQGRQYAVTYRGNTIVDISPRDESPTKYHYFLRDDLRADKAPMKQVEQFVAEKILPLQ